MRVSTQKVGLDVRISHSTGTYWSHSAHYVTEVQSSSYNMFYASLIIEIMTAALMCSSCEETYPFSAGLNCPAVSEVDFISGGRLFIADRQL